MPPIEGEGEGLGDTDDTVLHQLTDDEWQTAHEALMGEVPPFPMSNWRGL